MSKWSVVVPTNRPDRFVQFLEAWSPLFEKHDVTLYVIQDLPEFAREITKAQALESPGFRVHLFCWQNIPDLHPRRADMIRSHGIHEAWRDGSDYTLTLDDDVRPLGDLFASYEHTFDSGAPCSPYFDVGVLTSYDGQMRGFPYGDRERRTVAVQYGGWHGVLDYDAPTQLAGVKEPEVWLPLVVPIPCGAAVTGCIMNAAWRTEYAPIMWQLPLYRGVYNRFGDIWSCLFAKKTLDHLGDVMVINGEASVLHERASDPISNLEREAPGIPLNEDIWGKLYLQYGVKMLDTYRAVTDSAFNFFRWKNLAYAEHFRQSRDEWLELFS